MSDTARLDFQVDYWNRIGPTKTFAHPVNIEKLSRWVEPHSRILDYGCGSGWFAHRMRERGWQVTGMDMSAHAVEKARNHFGLHVIHGTLPHGDVKPESFDVVTLGAVLEHLHWPHKVIGAAAQALVPGGYLVLSVPNMASWGFR